MWRLRGLRFCLAVMSNAAKPGSAHRGYFVFIIRALSPTSALSHAIFVSDFQDLRYCCSWSPKRPRARPEARRAWIAGRLLRKRRGSIRTARRCGGASSHVDAPAPAAEGLSRRKKRLAIWIRPQALEKGRKKLGFRFPWLWISSPMIWIFLPVGFGNPSTNFVMSRHSRETTPLPLAFIEIRAAGEGAPFPLRLSPLRVRTGERRNSQTPRNSVNDNVTSTCVNLVVYPARATATSCRRR